MLDPARATIVVAGPYAAGMTTRAVPVRRRLHADLSGSDVSGRGLPGVLSTSRGRGRCAAVRRGCRRCGVRLLDIPEDTVYDDEIYVAYTRHIIEGRWAAAERRPWLPPAKSTASGRPATTSSCTRTSPTRAALADRRGIRHRPGVELAPVSRVVPVALRAAGADHRHGFVVGARPDEAASQHLHGGARADGRASRPTR